MSFDLQLWSIQPVGLHHDLPDAEAWHALDNGWSWEGHDWQIAAGHSNRVAPEDIPDEVAKLLPGISFLTEISLSPITAGANARRLIDRIAMKLAKKAHGVIFDPQTDRVTTARGVTRLTSLGSRESASVIALSWWFVSGPLIERNVSGLLSALESCLPEALPKRYGSYEPPQHVFDEMGRDHFVSFFRNTGDGLGSVVWYPYPPVADVSVSIPPYVG